MNDVGIPYAQVELAFDVFIKDDACLIAKIYQADKYDQCSNSYHVMSTTTQSYFARHEHIMGRLGLNPNVWERIQLAYSNNHILLQKNGARLILIKGALLQRGYAFLGTKGGEVHLRNVEIIGVSDEQSQETAETA